MRVVVLLIIMANFGCGQYTPVPIPILDASSVADSALTQCPIRPMKFSYPCTWQPIRCLVCEGVPIPCNWQAPPPEGGLCVASCEQCPRQ